MEALYAFMRVTDDLADEPGELEFKRKALEQWRTALDRALAGNDSHPLHPALRAVVERYRIPPRHLHEVIDGVESDLQPVRFKTFDELYAYCYRVASAVGLSCIHIWGFHEEKAKEYAEAAGIAFQLTNILRDLGEDLDHGRVYVPQDDIERFHCPPETWRQRTTPFRELMRFEVERAQEFYLQGERLSPYLDSSGRAVFQVMMRIYRGLLEEIVRRDYDVFGDRVRLSKWRKSRYLLAAFPTKWGWT
jgi:phytoene synthase